jgi:transposase
VGAAKKKAEREGRTLVFIDESAFMLKPIIGRTWAKKGKTPTLVVRDRRDRWSVIAAVTYRPGAKRRAFDMFFMAFDENIETSRAALFVRALRQHLQRKLTVIWDNLRVHHAAQKVLSRMKGSIEFEYLPPYAPQANPVEFLWAHQKGKELRNFTPDTKEELGGRLVETLRAARKRQDVLRGCFHAADLTL